MSNQLEVAQVVGIIGAAYPNFAASKETTTVYYELLKDLPFDLLKVATLKCCGEANRKFAPSVGEIRGACGDIQRRVQKIPTALEAWNEVCKAPISGEVIETGENPDGTVWITRRKFEWTHPIVGHVARLLGWPEFPGQNESTDRAHFFRMYEGKVNSIIELAVEIPDVTNYIESTRAHQLTAGLTKQLEAK